MTARQLYNALRRLPPAMLDLPLHVDNGDGYEPLKHGGIRAVYDLDDPTHPAGIAIDGQAGEVS